MRSQLDMARPYLAADRPNLVVLTELNGLPLVLRGGAWAIPLKKFERVATALFISRLARTLLVELLAWQFASPVRWIAEQVPVESVEDLPDGGVRVGLSDGATLEADVLLIATGRQPNGDRLNLEAGGIEANGTQVAVDEYGRASVEGVWALGDISSPFQLKHVANHEQRVLGHNLRHPDDLHPFHHSNVPYAVFTWPQIASVGLTESEARAAGYDVTVKTQDYGDVAYGWGLEDSTGVVKLVADRQTGQLLGAHYMGPQASTLIQQMITVLAYGLDLRDFPRSQYWIHPSLAEVTENAILGLDLTFKEV